MSSTERQPRTGSLCTGYRGLDTAVHAVFGGTTAWHADPGAGPTKILAHHWPDVPNLGDITHADWDQALTRHGPIDILAGGFPCQDVSLAGRHAGLTHGTRTGLWHQVARAIRQLQPRLVVIENVRGLLSENAHGHLEPCPWCVGDTGDEPVLRALGAVLGDLAGLGFDAEWIGVPASAAGAPHERFRVFAIAWPAASHPRGPGLEIRPVQPHGHQLPAPQRGGRELAGAGVGTRGGRWAPAIGHWARTTGRTAPDPADAVGQLNPAFSEWMQGMPAGHVTAVPGLTREEQLTAIGNGVVARQAEMALRLLAARATTPA